jgi:hypothetical protein
LSWARATEPAHSKEPVDKRNSRRELRVGSLLAGSFELGCIS